MNAIVAVVTFKILQPSQSVVYGPGLNDLIDSHRGEWEQDIFTR